MPARIQSPETLDRLESILRAQGATVFARINHAAAAAAAAAGFNVRPTQVLVFGNPKIGTPVMQAAPTIAIDLPFKALAWEDDSGKVWLAYNSAEYLARRHRAAEATVRTAGRRRRTDRRGAAHRMNVRTDSSSHGTIRQSAMVRNRRRRRHRPRPAS